MGWFCCHDCWNRGKEEKTFLLKVRIPGWAQGVENPYDLYRSGVKSAVNLKVNGKCHRNENVKRICRNSAEVEKGG